jgi:hypothetical protein
MEQRKRGRKPAPEGSRKVDTRVNVSLDIEAADSLRSIQSRLGKKLGFQPTLSQTLQWLFRVSDDLLNQHGDIKL